MIIDCHGHYTTVPDAMNDYRNAQLADLANLSRGSVSEDITDAQLRDSLEGAQLKLQRERGTDLTVFSPRASAMAHHLGSEQANVYWAEHWNNLIYRICQLYPDNFVPVGMLPQFPGVEPKNCLAEIDRIVNQLGFIGINLNPDPTGGYWSDPPLFDRWWYPVYEKMVELDIPAMVHVSQTRNPAFHFTGTHYINADTTAFMQLLTSDVLKDFPTLKLIIPHGGGAVPYHWGRYRGLAQDNNWTPATDLIKDNIYFDTCVYHQPGIDLLLKVIPPENILFGSEMVGAVRGVDPTTGFNYDDTKRYVDNVDWLSAGEKTAIYEGNVRMVFTRLKK
jgi:4-oxalmesaconate hydratase